MFGKVVAGAFLSLWFVLFTVEFSEDMGLINYDEPDMDHCIEATLASLGEAIKISDDLQLVVPCAVSTHLVGVKPSVARHEVSYHLIQQKAVFLKADIPIYKLDRALLI